MHVSLFSYLFVEAVAAAAAHALCNRLGNIIFSRVSNQICDFGMREFYFCFQVWVFFYKYIQGTIYLDPV